MCPDWSLWRSAAVQTSSLPSPCERWDTDWTQHLWRSRTDHTCRVNWRRNGCCHWVLAAFTVSVSHCTDRFHGHSRRSNGLIISAQRIAVNVPVVRFRCVTCERPQVHCVWVTTGWTCVSSQVSSVWLSLQYRRPSQELQWRYYAACRGSVCFWPYHTGLVVTATHRANASRQSVVMCCDPVQWTDISARRECGWVAELEVHVSHHILPCSAQQSDTCHHGCLEDAPAVTVHWTASQWWTFAGVWWRPNGFAGIFGQVLYVFVDGHDHRQNTCVCCRGRHWGWW